MYFISKLVFDFHNILNYKVCKSSRVFKTPLFISSTIVWIITLQPPVWLKVSDRMRALLVLAFAGFIALGLTGQFGFQVRDNDGETYQTANEMK